jgi:hypothetical protein
LRMYSFGFLAALNYTGHEACADVGSRAMADAVWAVTLATTVSRATLSPGTPDGEDDESCDRVPGARRWCGAGGVRLLEIEAFS